MPGKEGLLYLLYVIDFLHYTVFINFISFSPKFQMSNRLSMLETKKRQLFRKESSFFWKLRNVPVKPIVSHGRFQKLPNARPLNPASGWTQMNSEIRIENSVILEYEIRKNRKIFRSTCRNVEKKLESDTDKVLKPRHRLYHCAREEMSRQSLYLYLIYVSILSCVPQQLE